jgi:RNA polymerase sigma-70 factor (ECF subfamily)
MDALAHSSPIPSIARSSAFGRPPAAAAFPLEGAAPQRLDERLLQSVAAGDKAAMQVLYQRYSVRTYRFVLRLVGNASMAEDVVGEVFLNVWRDAASYQARSSVATWLLAIARNKAISALRRREPQLNERFAETVADTRDDPETQLDQKDRYQIIQSCLSKLSRDHREVIDLAYYHGKSVGEVAQIVGIPEGTVKTRMFHARKHMSKLLIAAGVNGVY